jgi:hypothetical protein
MEANDWLIAHGVQPTYDQEQQRYVVEDQQGAGIHNERE